MKKHKHNWQFAGFEGIYQSKWVCHCGAIKFAELKNIIRQKTTCIK